MIMLQATNPLTQELNQFIPLHN